MRQVMDTTASREMTIATAELLAALPVGYVILDHELLAVRQPGGWLYGDLAYHEPELPVEAVGMPD